MIPGNEDILRNIYEAQKRVESSVLQTPLLNCDWLSQETSINVFLKLESEQITGSFKLRGACNKITKLNEENRERFLKEPLITASSGNHALACGTIVGKLGLKLDVFTYKYVSETKAKKINALPNVTLTKEGEECCAAEMFARSHAEKNSLVYVSPYNDLDVIYGQATIGLELLTQNPSLDAVIVPVGGGGLISGIALAIKLIKPSIKIIGCQPENDCCMYESMKAGRILEDNEMSETFADGVAGRVEPGSVSFEICQRFVDHWVLVSEEDIERGVFEMLSNGKKLVEGAAGITIGALRKLDESYKNKNIALVICGANIGMNSVKKLITNKKNMENNYMAAMVLAGVGDAMGYKCGQWEFCFDGEKIHKELKDLGGISKLSVKKPEFIVSDDTVLLLATGEALVAKSCSSLEDLYQEIAFRYKNDFSKDMKERAGGATTAFGCHALRPHQKEGWVIPFNPRGGGCGGAMRSMCIGLRYPNIFDKQCFEKLIAVSVESARMTHNHPTGILGSYASALFGALSVCTIPVERWGSILMKSAPIVLRYIELQGRDVKENKNHWSYFNEKWNAYLKERQLESGDTKPVFPEVYGIKERDAFYKSVSFSGWGGASGHDAPMISYDALLYAGSNWETLCHNGMLHSGDNDSTGVIAGFCYGAMFGLNDVPNKNYEKVEYFKRLKTVGEKLYKLAVNDGYLKLPDNSANAEIPYTEIFVGE